MRDSPHSILHLAHPRPVGCSTIMTTISQVLELPVVAYDEWFQSLQGSEEKHPGQDDASVLKNNPALKLLEFFSAMRTTVESAGIPMMDMEKALQIASALNNLQQLSDANVLQWLTYWQLSRTHATGAAS